MCVCVCCVSLFGSRLVTQKVERFSLVPEGLCYLREWHTDWNAVFKLGQAHWLGQRYNHEVGGLGWYTYIDARLIS